jgi:hypothetical protein
MHLPQYTHYLSSVISGRTASVGLTGTNTHASIVLSEAFRAAHSSISILTTATNINATLTTEVLNSCNRFMERNRASLCILLEGDDLTVEQVAHLEKMLDRVKIRIVPSSICRRYSFNLWLVDDVAYRFQEDRNSPIALVSGGLQARTQAAHLAKIFSHIKEISISIKKFRRISKSNKDRTKSDW